MGLSKSLFTSFSQCPKALWLKVHRPELEIIPEALQARFEAGQQIGAVARQLFEPYVLVDTRKEDGRPDIDEMIHKTSVAIADPNTINICEAAFAFDGNYCAVDILHRASDGSWEIYEVKSSSVKPDDDKDVRAAIQEYLPDITYQTWLLRKRDINVSKVYIVLLNSSYVLDGELDVNGLFYKIDATEDVEMAIMDMDTRVDDANCVVEEAQEYIQPLGPYCKKPHDCAFMKYCMEQRGIKYPSVFNLYRSTWKKKLEFLEKGYMSFEDVYPEMDSLIKSGTQKMQIECTVNNHSQINKDGIKIFLAKLEYPLYYLDFETMQPAIPIYQGTHPYQQVPFQYSLHIKSDVDGVLTHKEFLGKPGEDPRRELAEQLCRDIPMGACSLAYNKAFECGRIAELAGMYPDLAEHLLDIQAHIVDLMEPFQGCCYYVPEMKDSFSIKSVLPALFPNSEELNYHNLNESVQNGQDAMTIFPRMAMMNESEQALARKSLLEYCCLDTLAMVRVLEKLYEAVQK